jgi:peptide-methionine (R)-S-oxide reductase
LKRWQWRANAARRKGTLKQSALPPHQIHVNSETQLADKLTDKLTKTDEEWRNQLSPEQYQVTRHAGTEPAFTGKYWKTKDPGTYTCVCCGQPLFSSETKFDSGTGWPSFTDPAVAENIELHRDTSHFMIRTEATCARCGSHLGHVFDDGPGASGQRWCMNSCALDLDRSGTAR